MGFFHTEDFTDFVIEIFDIIAIALLAKAAEMIKILSDLRCGSLPYL